MKVILLEDVKKQGKKDQVIDVSDGYAKNFLINKGLAVPYNTQNKNKLDRELKAKEDEETNKVNIALDIKKKLDNVTIKFNAKVSNDGRMFGSISNKQIETELKKLGFDVDKKMIECDHPIDTLGVHNVSINLHKKVVAEIKVNVL